MPHGSRIQTPAPLTAAPSHLWRSALGAEWRATLLSWLDARVELGRKLLGLLARAFDLPEPALLMLSYPQPYALMKRMRYAPKHGASEPRTSMAAHCNFSLLTLLLQSVDGLQIRTLRRLDRRARMAPARPEGSAVLRITEITATCRRSADQLALDFPILPEALCPTPLHRMPMRSPDCNALLKTPAVDKFREACEGTDHAKALSGVVASKRSGNADYLSRR